MLAADLFEAGAVFLAHTPAVVVLDFDGDRQASCRAAAWMRASSAAPTLLLGIFGEDEPDPEVYRVRGVVDECWKKPYSVKSLADRLSEVLDPVGSGA